MNFSAVLTQYCNLSCKHCYLPSLPVAAKKADDLDWTACGVAFRNLGEQFGDQVEEVYLTGGEFLTLSYGEHVVALARECFPRSTIFVYTNGLLFLEDPGLFRRVVPHVFHVGLDAWHGGVDRDGRSAVAERFLEYREGGGEAALTFHWTRKDGDEETYRAFQRRYQDRDRVVIEDRSLNTTTGRAVAFERPRYREDEVWRPCDFGRHILLRYNSRCYSCHYAVESSAIGGATDMDLRTRTETLLGSALGQVLHSSGAELFYRYVCEKHGIAFSANRCLLCEAFFNHGVDTCRAAEEWLCGSRQGALCT
jgi:hypothetical protein